MDIFKEIDQNTTILTPNRRLAATTLKKFNDFQSMGNKLSWDTMDVIPFQSWIQRLWNNLIFTEDYANTVVLTPAQEFLIWESIIKKSPHNDTLLQISPTADLAIAAWGTLKQWQVSLTHPMLGMTEDSAAFLQWAITYERLCKVKGWIDFNSLIETILDLITKKQISLPSDIVLLGFTEFTPIQKTLFRLCENVGTVISYKENLIEKSHSKAFTMSFTDTETEIRSMARWAKKIASSEKNTKVGCIVPSLENCREQVIQIFSEVFSEHHSTLTDETFNISAGKSLMQYPVINAALKLLEPLHEIISTPSLTNWLTTPFIGEAETEQTKRASYDARLRRANATNINFHHLLDENKKLSLKKYCPLLARRLDIFHSLNMTQPNEQAPSQWANHFMNLLNAIGWPGERSLNSHEYQVVQRFCDALLEYQSFDTITEKTSYSDALKHLELFIKKMIFQPQSSDAPIQVLGLLEAANLPFNYSWVMGLDDSVWPPGAKPNPFIPQKLQKMLQMPHSSAEKELNYCAKLTRQLIESTDNIIFSHPLKNGDCELRPSALITSYPNITMPDLPQSDFVSTAELLYQHKSCEEIQDNYAPPVQSDETLRGGVSILKKQALCPFKAFAEIRLHASALPTITHGLRPEDRGTVTHKALELAWNEMKDSDTLHSLDDDTLKQLLLDCSEKAIEEKLGKNPLETRYLSIEVERLQTLLWNWMQKEKTRESFQVIAQEVEKEVTFGDLTFQCRVDRIDALENHDHLVIDYKTGKNHSIKHWFSDRPEDPQLPLYCLSDPLTIKGIAFASVHPDTLTMTGITKNKIDLDRAKTLDDIPYATTPHWDEQIKLWQKVFNQLSDEFTAGNAFVLPKNSNETCQYCELKPLCRIQEKLEQ